MSFLNTGEANRLKPGSQWQLTIEDLCDLMQNYPKNGEYDEPRQREYASRAISLVLGNLERRGVIDDQFIDLGEQEGE